MDPILDVRPVRPGLFTYSLRAPGQPARPCDDFFESLEHCFDDAARSLLNYFDRVQVHLRGLPIGTYAVVRLLQDPVRIADELHERFARVYGDTSFDDGPPVPLTALRPVKAAGLHLHH